MDKYVTADLINLEEFFPIMNELRRNLSTKEFFEIYKQASEINGYKIIGLKKGQTIVAIMGYRVLYDYVHGKHLYIDDQVPLILKGPRVMAPNS